MAAVPPNSPYDPRNPLGLPPPQIGWRGVPAQPSSLDGDCGPGYQQHPAWQTLRLTPLPGTAQSGAHLTAARSEQSEESLIRRLLASRSLESIRHFAELLLGPQSFELGVCFGVAKNLGQAIVGLYDILKTLVLAGLYERAIHPPPWWDAVDLPSYWEARLAQALVGQQMKAAQEQIEKLKAQLAEIMKDPIGFFKSLGTSMKAEYVGKWNRFQRLQADTSLSSQFDAGEIFGEVLAEVVLTVLMVIDGVGVVAKLASKVPELLRLVETVRTVEAASKVEGAAEAVKVGEEASTAELPNSRMGSENQSSKLRDSQKQTQSGKIEASKISLARVRQARMLSEDKGFNVSPTSWDSYPTIGRNGSFLTDKQAISDVIGDLPPGTDQMSISSSQASSLENAMGLNPGSLQDGFKIHQVEGIQDMAPRSPLEGNNFFQGPGNHLPGGGPELVVNSISTTDNGSVTTIMSVLVTH